MSYFIFHIKRIIFIIKIFGSYRKNKQRDSISVETQNKDISESSKKMDDDDVFVKPAQPKPIVEPKEHVMIECIVNKDKNVSSRY